MDIKKNKKKQKKNKNKLCVVLRDSVGSAI